MLRYTTYHKLTDGQHILSLHYPFITFAVHNKIADIKRYFPPTDGIDGSPEILVGLFHDKYRATYRKFEEIGALLDSGCCSQGVVHLVMLPVVLGNQYFIPCLTRGIPHIALPHTAKPVIFHIEF